MKSPALTVVPSNRGAVLTAALILVGILGIIFAAYLSLIDHQLRLVTRVTARAQALYLAEAGLDAANDLLSERWEAYQDETLFPMRERVAASPRPFSKGRGSRHGLEIPVGEFEVVVNALTPRSLRVTSTGRTRPTSRRGADGPEYQVERMLSMVIVRKDRPTFQRQGYLGWLELAVTHFDKNGLPDLLAFSGALDAAHDPNQLGGLLTAGSPDAMRMGYHLFASFVDVDGDGNLDLILSDAPSRGHAQPGSFIPSLARVSDGGAMSVVTTTAADVFHTGTPIPVVAHGWLWLPEGGLSDSEPGTDVFLNQTVYDGTRIISWSERQVIPRQRTP